MNDAPRRWWNILDKALCSYGMVPTRADTLDSGTTQATSQLNRVCGEKQMLRSEKMLDPIAGSPATRKTVARIIDLFVDDLFVTSGTEMEQRVPARLGKDFQVGSEDWNDVTPQDKEFVGRRILNRDRASRVSQQKAIDDMEEIPVERNTKDDLHCTPAMHTRYRSLVGQINWLQSRTQFQCCYKFSRCALKAASPTIGDVNNKLARQLKSQPVKLQFWPLTGALRIRLPDASYRQGGMAVFLAESRERSSKDGVSYGCLIDDESQKIIRTVLSTTVAKLFSFMKCFGSCQFLRGLWMNISGEVANIHMRTDAKNLATTARTIHLPELKETINMISMLRKACSRSIHYLAHIPTQNCLADCLTKSIGDGRPFDYSREN